MARYIDADLFKKNIKIVTPDMFENCSYCGLYDDVDIKVMINEQPTADVQEIKHGHWDGGFHDYYCSVCGQGEYTKTNYCSNCGAKMEVE